MAVSVALILMSSHHSIPSYLKTEFIFRLLLVWWSGSEDLRYFVIRTTLTLQSRLNVSVSLTHHYHRNKLKKLESLKN